MTDALFVEIIQMVSTETRDAAAEARQGIDKGLQPAAVAMQQLYRLEMLLDCPHHLLPPEWRETREPRND